jgi:FkbM family methyltransferase
MHSRLVIPRRSLHAIRNAFWSEGFRLFGIRFARDYLRFAWRCARNWGGTGAGTLEMAGFRIEYFNQSQALFLVHEVFVNGTYAFVARHARPRIIDCGANIGVSTLFFKALYPLSSVIAIEPDRAAFDRLSDTVARNRLREVTLINAALGEVEGTTPFYRDASDPGSITASTIRRPGGTTSEQAPSIRLSPLISEPVDFLKLDVEGAEYGVLRELVAADAIRSVRQMVVEYHQVDAEPFGADWIVNALKAAGMQIEHLSFDRAARSGVFRATATSFPEPSPNRTGRRE